MIPPLFDITKTRPTRRHPQNCLKTSQLDYKLKNKKQINLGTIHPRGQILKGIPVAS